MSAPSAQLPILDHIVILVSHDTLLGLSDRISHLFTLAPGGTHADGRTTNKLILLPDGVYLEFIAFFDHIDPESRKQHRWGSLPEGSIVDWALTLPPSSDFAPIEQRVQDAQASVFYEHPVPGGRTKEDGTELKWKISAPFESTGSLLLPGRLPFWCLDETPRDQRVPYTAQPHLTQHPSGVQAVSAVSVAVPNHLVADLARVYSVLGDATAAGSTVDRVWQYRVPSGSTDGRQTVSLSGTGGETVITLTFSGPNGGKVELLPGLVCDVE
ncbi:uncharacterized protein N7459_004014 [Penicillium hispanicum]|uniref:uncharacterized protein n=1 Tax=Penicillium hispanicum TaxID=1080232 RepID=UPI002541EF4E|nr:uncharacterized protein N7459_004014 [Penicillium hispanicum]KAJ5584214.1 hypothetical protein N7459_004014 [Penicillium hispanicum]